MSDKTAIALLKIEDDQTFISAPEGVTTLPFGSKSLSNKYFIHTPPNENEIEIVINLVEDALMPIVADIKKKNYQLVTLDKNAKDIAFYAEVEGTSLSVKDVEGIFSRMAAIITGRPASTDLLPEENSFIAYELILREVMNHLGFHNIVLITSQ
ncbi:MAG: hypothetical protein LKI39_13305 [Bacteroides sp.]|jgi:exopolyphosphatase/pppGpp-phosphohydrolase|nr:hypothetical protein [Bacteroides sp.]MCI1683514.1 hypothetical protein [Bacteroides sp.]